MLLVSDLRQFKNSFEVFQHTRGGVGEGQLLSLSQDKAPFAILKAI